MKLIVCLDDAGGMMFNRRRQSRDRVLMADMIRHVGKNPLRASAYSAPLFGEDAPTLCIVPNPVEGAKRGDYCFVEDCPLPQNAEVFEELIIYRWNRRYPSDVRFTCDTSAFALAESCEFAGSSHDKITKEIWKK